MNMVVIIFLKRIEKTAPGMRLSKTQKSTGLFPGHWTLVGRKFVADTVC